jgi:hypothetical protein
MTKLQQFAVALLAGVMMVARSPSAIIAVTTEMKAVGRYLLSIGLSNHNAKYSMDMHSSHSLSLSTSHSRYTNIIIGVTILCDAIVILFFNLNDIVAGLLLAEVRGRECIFILARSTGNMIIYSFICIHIYLLI